MARHAAPGSEDLGVLRDKPVSARTQRAAERARQAEERRLAEREHVSGQIRTPKEITARRARRTDRPGRPTTAPSKKTPVSARTLVPERTLSGRMIVLTIVTLVVISFLVPTVRTYLQQQSELTQLSEDIAAEEQRQDELHRELARWDDPEFIRQQARERLNLALPGERRYHVVGDLAEQSEDFADEELIEDDEGWTDELWDSVVDSAQE